ncbi:hypothetical protein [Actinoplanes siamensis]|uniref:DUF11 domain-containing protein n=1 Tax=Actinoplanes siamensis TaxID=1223317 RepID=A0A919TJZ2_9ACTN|nr:hypothetical protein [Actinoplanes siamensis]GIF04898.1 hypothetical protein Asi03nite_24360 [Actinoplanes siamensis]
MRTVLRAGAVALAAGSVLFGGAAAAQAAPAGVTVSVNRLILEPGQFGHSGSIRITVKNRTSEPVRGNIAITEPIESTFDQFLGASGCGLGATGDNRTIAYCNLDNAIQPGANGTVTVTFRSPAKPQAFAQAATQSGTVEVAGATAEFATVFRSTSGKLTNPAPYVPDTEPKLAVTAGDVTLTRQQDGTFLGAVPVTVRSNGDAPHRGLGAEIATPAGVNGWPEIFPSEVCVGGGELPVPPGGSSEACSVAGGQIAEGQERTFEWVLTAPADTPIGSLGTGSTLVRLEQGPSQTGGANIATFTITVAE